MVRLRIPGSAWRRKLWHISRFVDGFAEGRCPKQGKAWDERRMDSVEEALKVAHGGREYEAAPGSILIFGRGSACQVRIGTDNPTVHRRVGSFHWKGGQWQVHNDGSRCASTSRSKRKSSARIAGRSRPPVAPQGARGTLHILTLRPLSLSFTTPASAGISIPSQMARRYRGRDNPEHPRDAGPVPTGLQDARGAVRTSSPGAATAVL